MPSNKSVSNPHWPDDEPDNLSGSNVSTSTATKKLPLKKTQKPAAKSSNDTSALTRAKTFVKTAVTKAVTTVASQVKQPKSTRDNVEGGFELFLRRLNKYASKKSPSRYFELEDVDFVLIVKKPQTSRKFQLPSVSGCCKAKCYEHDEENLSDVRLDYLNALKDGYRISYQVLEAKKYAFYLINLPYYHLGLLAELLHYSWQIKTSDKDKVAYKNLSFFKWPADNVEDFQNCRNRRDFPPRMRFDLAYNFLLGATVSLESPEVRQTAHCGCCPTIESEEKLYNITRVMSENLFDDWLIPHTPLNAAPVQSLCCEKYMPGCLPCIEACRSNDDDKDGESSDEESDGALRAFLCRHCTLKSAFSLKPNFPKTPDEVAAKANLWHLIPVHHLAAYAGEKVAFYFAWLELFVLGLLVPAFLGAGTFIGMAIYYALEVFYFKTSTNNGKDISSFIEYVLVKTCDNYYGTPAFAVFMVIWSTVFYEVWLRRESWYRFLWKVEDFDVDEFEQIRIERSNFDKNNNEDQPSALKSCIRCLFYLVSLVTTTAFIFLGLSSVYMINVINLFAFDHCPASGTSLTGFVSSSSGGHSSNSTLLGTATAAVEIVICQLFGIAEVLANSIVVFFLNLLYTKICYKLTDWEGHTKPSSYTNSLVFKLFVFRFFNVYSVLFFTAFGSNILSLKFLSFLVGGKGYKGNSGDANGCGNQPCLMQLTKQLLGILITQPIFGCIAGLIAPSIAAIHQAVKRKALNTVGINDDDDEEQTSDAGDAVEMELVEQTKLLKAGTLENQDFFADDFTQDVITFGLLVMFSVALPPAAAVTLIFMRVNLPLGIRQMLKRYRRPIPLRANGIGIWRDIVNLFTYLSIVTNPLIVILTSSWGAQFDSWTKFWIFIGFEHVVIAIRVIVALAVPDKPSALERQRLRRKIIEQDLLDELVISNNSEPPPTAPINKATNKPKK